MCKSKRLNLLLIQLRVKARQYRVTSALHWRRPHCEGEMREQTRKRLRGPRVPKREAAQPLGGTGNRHGNPFWFSSQLSSCKFCLLNVLHQACIFFLFFLPCHMEERNKYSLHCQTYRCIWAKCLKTAPLLGTHQSPLTDRSGWASLWLLLHWSGEPLILMGSAKFFREGCFYIDLTYGQFCLDV